VRAVSLAVVLFCRESGKHQNEKVSTQYYEEFKVSRMKMLSVQACSPSLEGRRLSYGCPEVFFVEKSALHRMPMPSSFKRNITSQDGISYVQQFFAHGDECDFSEVFSTLYGGVVVLTDERQVQRIRSSARQVHKVRAERCKRGKCFRMSFT